LVLYNISIFTLFSPRPTSTKTVGSGKVEVYHFLVVETKENKEFSSVLCWAKHPPPENVACVHKAACIINSPETGFLPSRLWRNRKIYQNFHSGGSFSNCGGEFFDGKLLFSSQQ
jgi:hypothetical protein